MMTHKPLGHRANPRRQPLRARESFDAGFAWHEICICRSFIDQTSVAQREIVPLQENPELRETGAQELLKNPWRQLSLMASHLDWLLPLVNFH